MKFYKFLIVTLFLTTVSINSYSGGFDLGNQLDSNASLSNSTSTTISKDDQSYQDAEACFSNKDYVCAENVVNTILAIDPENKRALNIRAQIAQVQSASNNNSSLANINASNSNSRSTPINKDDQRFQDSEACFIKKDYECAENITNTILANDPENIKAKNGLLRIYLNKCLQINDLNCANQNIISLMELEPENKELLTIKDQIIKAQKNETLFKDYDYCMVKKDYVCGINNINARLINDPDNKELINAKAGLIKSQKNEQHENDYNSCLVKKDYVCAENALDEVLVYDPENTGVPILKAQLLQAKSANNNNGQVNIEGQDANTIAEQKAKESSLPFIISNLIGLIFLFFGFYLYCNFPKANKYAIPTPFDLGRKIELSEVEKLVKRKRVGIEFLLLFFSVLTFIFIVATELILRGGGIKYALNVLVALLISWLIIFIGRIVAGAATQCPSCHTPFARHCINSYHEPRSTYIATRISSLMRNNVTRDVHFYQTMETGIEHSDCQCVVCHHEWHETAEYTRKLGYEYER